jgi:hypothetical protein
MDGARTRARASLDRRQSFNQFPPVQRKGLAAHDACSRYIDSETSRSLLSETQTEGMERVQLKVLGSPSTYTSAGSGQFVSAASYFGVLPDQGFEITVCSRCRQPEVETAGEPATADRSDVVSIEVSLSMHRLHDDSAETDRPAPVCLDFRWRPGFQQFLRFFVAPGWR